MKEQKKDCISVIIPVFNTGEACIKLLSALLESPFKNKEIICVDDGSKDNSLKLLKDFSKNHPVVKVFHQENAGPSAARNTGIQHATGNYVIFVDSDDMVKPEFLSELHKAFSPKTVLACTSILYSRLALKTAYPIYTKRLRKHKKHESLKSYVLYLMRYDGRLYGVHNNLLRLDIIKNNNLKFDTSIRFAEDTSFMLDYIEAAGRLFDDDYTLSFIYKPLYIYNYGTETSVVAKSSLSWDGWQKSYNKLRDWASTEKTVVAKTRLLLIWVRWKISYILNVQRANISRREKLQHAGRLELLLARLVLLIRK